MSHLLLVAILFYLNMPGLAHALEQALPNGDTMHYEEVGQGRTILMVHGYPTSSYLYRKVMKEICGVPDSPYRCVAIDLIGFGRSSCPGDGSAVSPLYEVDRVSEFIEMMGLEDFAIVVHDWGGPIGTTAAMRHADNLSHLIILNTFYTLPGLSAWGWMTDVVATLLAQPWLMPQSAYVFLLGRGMQDFTTVRLTKDELEHYREPFRNPCRVRASMNLLGKAHKDSKLFEELSDRLRTLWSERPVMLLWGTRDPLLGPYSPLGRTAYRDIKQLLPQAETYRIRGANHFLQEDAPADIADSVRGFLE